MKRLNTTSTATLNKMVSMMEDGFIKIDNFKGFMPVSVEVIYTNDKYMIVSVAHYYEQNGDLMADPEVCFIYNKITGDYFPSYFKQDNVGIEQESIIMNDGVIKGIRTIMQLEHSVFANMWLENIKDQQKL